MSKPVALSRTVTLSAHTYHVRPVGTGATVGLGAAAGAPTDPVGAVLAVGARAGGPALAGEVAAVGRGDDVTADGVLCGAEPDSVDSAGGVVAPDGAG